jgi:hypothetical protein
MDSVTKKISDFRSSNKPHTWRTVLDFIQEMGFDNDEYFHLFPDKRHFVDQPIWDKQNWISVFWVVGGSEGYYIHVENRMNDYEGDHANLIILGKFWDWERAEEATQAVQRFINFF